MTVTAKPLFEAKAAETAQTTQYTAPAGTRTIIDKCTAYNSDTATRTIAFNLVPNGGSAGASNKVLNKSLAADETYTFPEIVGHVLENGGLVSAIADSANKVVVRLSGREVT